jgi:hypothetical protein
MGTLCLKQALDLFSSYIRNTVATLLMKHLLVVTEDNRWTVYEFLEM